MDSDPTIELSYDRAAEAYAMALYNELSGKPLDRLLLREFAERIQPGGLVCDAGCGPGQIAAELRSAGVDVFGVDISGAMVDAASKRNADIRFEQLDFVATVPGTGLAGIVSFYSIVHLNDESLKHVLKNFAAALGPNGWLLLAFHTGNGVNRSMRCLAFRSNLSSGSSMLARLRCALSRRGSPWCVWSNELPTRMPSIPVNVPTSWREG